MRILDQQQVAALLPMRECIPVMESALAALARGDAALPLRMVMPVSGQHGGLALMPAHVPPIPALGVKLITVFPGNHGTKLDSHQGAVLLFDPDNGALVAMLDASAITAIRTAAVSAVATRLLAREDASVLALLGSGVQARTHLEAMALVRPLRSVRVYSRSVANARAFAERAQRTLQVHVEVLDQARHAVEGADIVCTVTSSRTPVLMGEWLAPGVHVNAVGASQPDARELDSEAVARARLFADRRESLERESADYLTPLREGRITPSHMVGEIGEVALGRVAGRQSPTDITLFKSLGLAVEDVAAAAHVLARAEREQVGTVVALGGRRLD